MIHKKTVNKFYGQNKKIRMKNHLASVKHKFLRQIQSIYQTQNFKINIDDTPADE